MLCINWCIFELMIVSLMHLKSNDIIMTPAVDVLFNLCSVV